MREAGIADGLLRTRGSGRQAGFVQIPRNGIGCEVGLLLLSGRRQSERTKGIALIAVGMRAEPVGGRRSGGLAHTGGFSPN